ncbi:hypothetical protein PVK06_039354 [Gossypium arboreum]|uniref:Uncharacterized protein n=1 Tax=Gossypium arboreum TaxID=29729 RepID=A0ABR0N2M9_GOSAR|nr:hypothetical protein PVK06_039354 [Gossypium arboreum]
MESLKTHIFILIFGYSSSNMIVGRGQGDLEKIGVGRGLVRGGVSRRFGRGRGHEHERDGPIAVFKLSKRKADDNLQMLHIILFGKKVKPHNLKRNIGQFSGYVWVENESLPNYWNLESLHATTDVLLADKEQAAKQDYEKEILNKRIAKLSGGVAVIQGVCWNSQFGIQRLSAETGAASIYCGF